MTTPSLPPPLDGAREEEEILVVILKYLESRPGLREAGENLRRAAEEARRTRLHPQSFRTVSSSLLPEALRVLAAVEGVSTGVGGGPVSNASSSSSSSSSSAATTAATSELILKMDEANNNDNLNGGRMISRINNNLLNVHLLSSNSSTGSLEIALMEARQRARRIQTEISAAGSLSVSRREATLRRDLHATFAEIRRLRECLNSRHALALASRSPLSTTPTLLSSILTRTTHLGNPLIRGPIRDSMELESIRKLVVLRKLTLHHASAFCVVTSGRFILTGGDDFMIKVTDSHTGMVTNVLRGHRSEIVDLACSSDGYLASSDQRTTEARFWEIASGRCLAVMGGHTQLVCRVAFAQGGRRLLTCSDDGCLVLWDASDVKQQIRESDANHAARLAREAEKRRLAALATSASNLSENNNINAGTTTTPTTPLANTPQYNPFLARPSPPVVLPHWNAEARKPVPISSLAVHPRGMFVCTGGEDSILRVWSLEDLPSELNHPIAPTFSSNAGVFNYPEWKNGATTSLCVTLSAHTDGIVQGSWSNAGDRVVSFSDKDGTARVWSWRREERSVFTGGPSTRRRPTMNSSSSSSTSTSAKSWMTNEQESAWIEDLELLTGKPQHIVLQALRPPRSGGRGGGGGGTHSTPPVVCAAKFTCRDDVVVTLQYVKPPSYDPEVYTQHRVVAWDARTGAVLSASRGHYGEAGGLAPHPRLNDVVATHGSDPHIIFWDVRRGVELARVNSLSPNGYPHFPDARWCVASDRANDDGAGAVEPDGVRGVCDFAAVDMLGRLLLIGCGEPGGGFPSAYPEQFYTCEGQDVTIQTNGAAVDTTTSLPVHVSPLGAMVDSQEEPYMIQPMGAEADEATNARNHLARRAISMVRNKAINVKEEEARDANRALMTKLLNAVEDAKRADAAAARSSSRVLTQPSGAFVSSLPSSNSQSGGAGRSVGRPRGGGERAGLLAVERAVLASSGGGAEMEEDEEEEEVLNGSHEADGGGRLRRRAARRAQNAIHRQVQAIEGLDEEEEEEQRDNDGEDMGGDDGASASSSSVDSSDAELVDEERYDDSDDENDTDDESDFGETRRRAKDKRKKRKKRRKYRGTVFASSPSSRGLRRSSRVRRPVNYYASAMEEEEDEDEDEDDFTRRGKHRSTTVNTPVVASSHSHTNRASTAPNPRWLMNSVEGHQFVPQTGDRVVYFVEGHQSFLNEYPTTDSPPWLGWNAKRWPFVLLELRSVHYKRPVELYSFSNTGAEGGGGVTPNAVGGNGFASPNVHHDAQSSENKVYVLCLCRATVVGVPSSPQGDEGEIAFVAPPTSTSSSSSSSSSSTPPSSSLEFSFVYRPSSTDDFIVLEAKFQAGMRTRFARGDRVLAPFIDGLNDVAPTGNHNGPIPAEVVNEYSGRVEGVFEEEEDDSFAAVKSPWKSLKVFWDSPEPSSEDDCQPWEVQRIARAARREGLSQEEEEDDDDAGARRAATDEGEGPPPWKAQDARTRRMREGEIVSQSDGTRVNCMEYLAARLENAPESQPFRVISRKPVKLPIAVDVDCIVARLSSDNHFYRQWEAIEADIERVVHTVTIGRSWLNEACAHVREWENFAMHLVRSLRSQVDPAAAEWEDEDNLLVTREEVVSALRTIVEDLQTRCDPEGCLTKLEPPSSAFYHSLVARPVSFSVVLDKLSSPARGYEGGPRVEGETTMTMFEARMVCRRVERDLRLMGTNAIEFNGLENEIYVPPALRLLENLDPIFGQNGERVLAKFTSKRRMSARVRGARTSFASATTPVSPTMPRIESAARVTRGRRTTTTMNSTTTTAPNPTTTVAGISVNLGGRETRTRRSVTAASVSPPTPPRRVLVRASLANASSSPARPTRTRRGEHVEEVAGETTRAGRASSRSRKVASDDDDEDDETMTTTTTTTTTATKSPVRRRSVRSRRGASQKRDVEPDEEDDEESVEEESEEEESSDSDDDSEESPRKRRRTGRSGRAARPTTTRHQAAASIAASRPRRR